MTEKYRFEVYVTGDGISPETLKVKAIADYLVVVEEIVAAVAEDERPDLQLKRRGALGLTSLHGGSIRIAYTAQNPIVGVVLRKIGRVVDLEEWTSLSSDAIEKIQKLVKLNRTHNSIAEIRESQNDNALLAVFTPETRVAGKQYIVGTTTLYGELLRIGGENSPTAQIRFARSTSLTCDVKTTELASAMAERLYEAIGVRGTAKWDSDSRELKAFRVEELTEYRKTSLSSAFESLREVAGKYYEEIEDVNAFVAELRGRGPEEE